MSQQVEVIRISNAHPLILTAKKNILRNLEIVGKIIPNENLP